MERKIGEIFTYNGKTYQVVKSNTCMDCAFRENECSILISRIGLCTTSIRSDKTDVVFKEIKDMEIKNNQLTINIPKRMEIDIENSDFTKGIIKFKPKYITYDDIVNSTNSTDSISALVQSGDMFKLIAIKQLINIASYYNKDWKPNWNNKGENKYFIIWNNECKTYWTDYNRNSSRNVVYFKNREDAQSVIDNPNFREILDTIYKY